MVEDDAASGESVNDASGPAQKAATRRRASRPAGPAAGETDGAVRVASVGVDAPTTARVRVSRPVAPPPRRQPHRTLVAIVALSATAVVAIVLAVLTGVLYAGQREADAQAARDQRFVDTATQTVINMFTYDQNTIDESVNAFVNGTSGPLRDMLSQGNNVDNLKALFRDTNASSEAVINGAALERVDDVARNANVLVSVRVTVTDLDGVNKPSQPYRMRVIVHEDDNGHMTGYDLKYPEGGN
jgi:Mce-associated membrane protein